MVRELEAKFFGGEEVQEIFTFYFLQCRLTKRADLLLQKGITTKV